MSRIRRRGVAAEDWGRPERDRLGRPICRWCRALVRPPRRTFCGDPCVHEWRLRSDPSYVRTRIWARDRGVCQRCAIDLLAAERRWKRQRPAATDRRARRAWRLARPRWEADHIVPVAEGGGECGLENYRLLCRACHVAVTSEWRMRRSRVHNAAGVLAPLKRCATGTAIISASPSPQPPVHQSTEHLST